jgi:hypothetical protein
MAVMAVKLAWIFHRTPVPSGGLDFAPAFLLPSITVPEVMMTVAEDTGLRSNKDQTKR